MGRGGGGGSRGGGSHRSSSSRGGSYRSSGGSRGGGSSSSFHSSSHVHVHHSYGRSYYGGTSTVSGGFVFTLAFLMLVSFAFIILLSIATGGTGGITKSTIDRMPLDKSYTTLETTWVYDDLGWIRSPSKVEQGLRHFYDKTGVQPILYLTETVNGDYFPSGQEVLDLANEIYDEVCSDEAHMVFVFQCKDEGTQYSMAACTGAQAKTVVDNEALEILYDYMDSYFWSDETEDDMFRLAFQKAADRIMKVTPDYSWVAIILLILLGILVIVFFILKAVFKRKREHAQETIDILNAPTGQYGSSGDPETERLKRKYDE